MKEKLTDESQLFIEQSSRVGRCDSADKSRKLICYKNDFTANFYWTYSVFNENVKRRIGRQNVSLAVHLNKLSEERSDETVHLQLKYWDVGINAIRQSGVSMKLKGTIFGAETRNRRKGQWEELDPAIVVW